MNRIFSISTFTLLVSLFTSYTASAQETYDPKTDSLHLRDYAEMLGKYIGVCVPAGSMNIANDNDKYAKKIYTEFNAVVAENEMKMDALEPSRGNFNYTNGDKLVNFARRHNMKVRGHTLCWHSQVPKWISEDGYKNDKNWSKKELLSILKRHIVTVMRHFKGKVAEWDVVNETLDDNQWGVTATNGKYYLRQSIWVKVIGEEFLDSAFTWAHREDPDAKLFLNDYGADFQGGAKSNAMFNLVKRMKNSGVPIDGVGLQCHLSSGDAVEGIAKNARYYKSKLGIDCIITELELKAGNNTTANMTKQAAAYKKILEGFLTCSNAPTMMIWGIDDAHTWIEGDQNPLIFDKNLQPKPAYYSLLEGFHNRYVTDIYQPWAEYSTSSVLDDAVYDVSGRKVANSLEDFHSNNSNSGIFIHNHKKFIQK